MVDFLRGLGHETIKEKLFLNTNWLEVEKPVRVDFFNLSPRIISNSQLKLPHAIN